MGSGRAGLGDKRSLGVCCFGFVGSAVSFAHGAHSGITNQRASSLPARPLDSGTSQALWRRAAKCLERTALAGLSLLIESSSDSAVCIIKRASDCPFFLLLRIEQYQRRKKMKALPFICEEGTGIIIEPYLQKHFLHNNKHGSCL